MVSEHDPKVPGRDEDVTAEIAKSDVNGHDEQDEVPVLDAAMLPEVVTELATISERHTWRLDELGTQVTDLDGRVTGQRTELSDLSQAFGALEEGLVEKVDLTKPSRWAWEFLTRDEAEQLWSETRWFVDYLIRRYPLSGEVSIAPCWYRHTVAVDELSDLYAAWREAYCAGSRPSSAMTAWRDRWLWPALHRLASYAAWGECKERRQHVEPSARQDRTDDRFNAFVDTDLAERPEERPKDVMHWPTKRPDGRSRQS